MKLIYDEKGRLSEVIGTGENGKIEEFEYKTFEKILDTETERYKSFNDASVEKHKSWSKAPSDVAKVISSTISQYLNEENSKRYIGIMFDPRFDQLDFSPNIISKDEKPFSPESKK